MKSLYQTVAVGFLFTKVLSLLLSWENLFICLKKLPVDFLDAAEEQPLFSKFSNERSTQNNYKFKH